MTLPPEPQPRQHRYRVRHQARLDAKTSATLEALANTSHRKRAAILRYVMDWGLARTQRWTINTLISDHPHLVHMLIEPDLTRQVQTAADSHGATMASWLRQAMRQVTRDDFPPSWRAGDSAPRSHESDYFYRKFGLRLDEVTSRKLEALTNTFHRSAAEIIRQLIAQVTLEDFPPRWQRAILECRASPARRDGIDT
jgi:predicted transcriptional regulator